MAITSAQRTAIDRNPQIVDGITDYIKLWANSPGSHSLTEASVRRHLGDCGENRPNAEAFATISAALLQAVTDLQP